MRNSEQTDKLFAALSQFQGKITNPPREAKNPFFGSKYTQLDTMIDHVRPTLAKYGLSVIQMPCSGADGVGVITTLCHTSGQFMQSDPYYLKLSKQDAQAGGSAITYARRYAFAAVLGIASDSDDDANDASDKSAAPEKRQSDGKTYCPQCKGAVENVQMKDGTIMPAATFIRQYHACPNCARQKKA